MRHYEEHRIVHTVTDSQEGGKSGRSAPDPPPHTIPLGYLPVLVGNKYVLLTRKECIEILKKGKKWRKVMAGRQRERSTDG